MLAYLVLARPFEDVVNNGINIYNELIVFLTFLFTILMNVYEFSEVVVRSVGWVLIGLITLSLVSIWVFTLPKLIKQLLEQLLARKKKKNSKKSSKKSKKSTKLKEFKESKEKRRTETLKQDSFELDKASSLEYKHAPKTVHSFTEAKS